MTDSNPMKNLYVRLEEADISESYVRDYILPEWWSDEIAESSTGFLEAIGYIAKHLGVEPSVLRDEDASLSAQNVAGTRFKLRADVDLDDVSWAQSIAVRAGEMAAYGTDTPFQLPSDATADSIRTQILENGAKWIDLPNLLSFCWDAGLPVLHVPEVPGKKMDGMVVGTEDRPVVILSLDHKHEAWLLFILAHELGHLVKGHVGKDEVLIDEDYDYAPDATDPHEQEANQFAVELLSGRPELKVRLRRFVEASDLAERFREVGAEEKIAPGAMVLNFAYHDPEEPWSLANATLNELHPDADAPELIRSLIRDRLNWAALPSESAEFLSRVCEIDQEFERVSAGH